VSLQPIEPAFPRRDVRAKPIVGAPKRPRGKGACSYAPGLFRRDEAAALEHANVLQQCWQPDLKRLGELADRGVSAAQASDDRAPSRIGQGRERKVQAKLILILWVRSLACL
jgi:hypothetical protein